MTKHDRQNMEEILTFLRNMLVDNYNVEKQKEGNHNSFYYDTNMNTDKLSAGLKRAVTIVDLVLEGLKEINGINSIPMIKVDNNTNNLTESTETMKEILTLLRNDKKIKVHYNFVYHICHSISNYKPVEYIYFDRLINSMCVHFTDGAEEKFSFSLFDIYLNYLGEYVEPNTQSKISSSSM